MSRRNEPVASVKELLFLILIVLLISLVMQTCGCSTYRTPVEYSVKPFKVVLAEDQYIQAMWEASGGNSDVAPDGFIDQQERTIYVPFKNKDIHGNPKPDMYVLGHEVWHLRELGGWWHR